MDIKKAKKKATTKAKVKVAKKCSKVKKACACLALLLAIVGCQQVPSRSQTLTVRDCVITIYGGGDTNGLASVEIGTQAMSIENSGTESLTPTQTTDTKPDIDVSVGAAKGGGILETAASKLLGSSDSSSSDTTASQSATSSTVDCQDGSCTIPVL